MDSVPTSADGIELYRQLSSLWQTAGMHARKWPSNDPQVLKEIPTHDCQAEVDLDANELPSVKTLGVLWFPKEDIFSFRSAIPEVNDIRTKRGFLKNIATLFDPLGFIAPFTVRAKMLLQDLWSAGVGWDDLLEGTLLGDMEQYCSGNLLTCREFKSLAASNKGNKPQAEIFISSWMPRRRLMVQ